MADEAATAPTGVGIAPYGIRYRWTQTLTGRPIDGQERERFFVTAEDRAAWVDQRTDRIAVLDRIDPEVN